MVSALSVYYINLEEDTVRSSGNHGTNNPNMAGSTMIHRVVKVIKTITISDLVERRSYESMTLVMWVIAGISFTRREFQSRQPLLPQLPEGKPLYQIASHPGRIKQNVDPFCLPISDILDFLAYCFQEGYE